MEAQGRCRLDAVLLSEVAPRPSLPNVKGSPQTNAEDNFDPHSQADYPINAMRNESLRRARTQLVLLVDVDFVVSANAQVCHIYCIQTICMQHLHAFQTVPAPNGILTNTGIRTNNGIHQDNSDTIYDEICNARCPSVAVFAVGFMPMVLKMVKGCVECWCAGRADRRCSFVYGPAAAVL